MMTEWQPEIDQPKNPLFTNGPNSNMNACVGDNGGPYGLFEYGRGFFAGGHGIVKTAQEHVAPVDLLIYPAAFSYRHGIELFLKHLIQSLHLVLEDGGTFKKNHSMIQLWGDVVQLHEAMGRDDVMDQPSIDRAGELIGHFDAFDPRGQVFRYPEDINANRHLAEHKLINVEVLMGFMKELQEILERWVYQVADYRDWQLEQIAEHGVE